MLTFLLQLLSHCAGCCYAAVRSGGRSLSAVRRTRRVPSLVLRRRAHSAAPSSPPMLRRAVTAPLSSPPVLRRTVPTSLSLPTSARTLLSMSSITVSLPRSFASELVAAPHENVTNVAVNPSPVTTEADDRKAVTARDDVTSLPNGLYLIEHCIFKFHRKWLSVYF